MRSLVVGRDGRREERCAHEFKLLLPFLEGEVGMNGRVLLCERSDLGTVEVVCQATVDFAGELRRSRFVSERSKDGGCLGRTW
jgi:hypothetical protein